MIHNVKDMYELYQQSRLAEIKEVAIKADRLGLKEMADKIFALHFEIKKSLAKTATHFLGVKKLIKHIEITSRFDELKAAIENEDAISEMRFEKGFPIPELKEQEEQSKSATADVLHGESSTENAQEEQSRESIIDGKY